METTITKKDLRKVYNRWWWTVELCNSYARMQTPSYCYAMQPLLRKLYTDDDAYRSALQRHMILFNTQGDFAGVCLGVSAAMEEEKARGEDIPAEAIVSVKTALMGPLAGIGDSVAATMNQIFYPIAIALSSTGSPLGFFFIWSEAIAEWLMGWKMCTYSYKVGRDGITKLLSSGMMNTILNAAGGLGLAMMGSLAASNVNFSLALSWQVGESEQTLQSLFDSILPGLLPLLAVWAIFFYMKKFGTNVAKPIVLIIALCLLLSFLQIV